MPTNEVYSIGHSTLPIDEFLGILDSFAISMLVDIRRYPGSRKHQQYDQENLKETLKKHHIAYCHMEELGGQRKPKKDSKNIGWKNYDTDKR